MNNFMKYENYNNEGTQGVDLKELTVETEDGSVKLFDLYNKLPKDEIQDVYNRAGSSKALLAELICIKTKIYQLTPQKLRERFSVAKMTIDQRRHELKRALDGDDKAECKAYIARERWLLQRLDRAQSN